MSSKPFALFDFRVLKAFLNSSKLSSFFGIRHLFVLLLRYSVNNVLLLGILAARFGPTLTK